MKYFFLDTETTGINPNKNAMVQLSAIIEIDGVQKEQINYFIKPFKGAEISEEALTVIGKTKEEIFSWEEPSVIFNQFSELLNKYIDPYDKTDKFHLLAYNAQFDQQFLRQFFFQNHSKFYASYFFFPPIDVMYLAAEHLKETRALMPNFKLETVAKFMNVLSEEENYHDALFDVTAMYQIYKKIISTNQPAVLDSLSVETNLKNEDTKEDNFTDTLF